MENKIQLVREVDNYCRIRLSDSLLAFLGLVEREKVLVTSATDKPLLIITAHHEGMEVEKNQFVRIIDKEQRLLVPAPLRKELSFTPTTTLLVMSTTIQRSYRVCYGSDLLTPYEPKHEEKAIIVGLATLALGELGSVDDRIVV